jgi:hypothetical protein
VVALAFDPNIALKAGKVLATWTLVKEYGFTDVDGSQPDWGTYFKENVTDKELFGDCLLQQAKI